ncbi:MAG: PAS domain S-box protein [candidate division Zixibacteria bacterium]|nr:PAS domain S-box protein [candidate division Zixibacteria bacterium]
MDKNAQIMIVEDEIIVAKSIQNRLKSLGYSVPAIASSGEEAIQKAKETNPDLLLMDIRLKGNIDGVEAARRINDNQSVPVIYLTAYADDNTLNRAKNTEPYGYLLKPFEPQVLHTTIEIALYKHMMEMKLKERKQKLENILEGVSDAVIVADAASIVTFMNPIAESLTGWKQSKACGKKLNEVFNTTIKEMNIKDRNRAAGVDWFSYDNQSQNRIILINKDNKEILIEKSFSPIRDDNGDITSFVLIFHDTSQYRQATENHTRDTDRFHIAIDSSYDWEYLIGADSNLIYVSPSCERITGYKVDEYFENSELLMTLTHPDDLIMFLNHCHEKKENRQEFSLDFRIITRNGEMRWVNHICRPVYNDDGSYLGRHVCNRDITERVLAKEMLQGSEERYRLFAENVTDVIWITDLYFNHIYSSPSVKHLRGFTVEEAINQSIEEMMSSDSIALLKKIISEKQNSNIREENEASNTQLVELEFYCKNGSTIWTESKISFLRDPNGWLTKIIGITRDISERKSAERQKEILIRELKEALGKIKTLSGLIPICPSCGKVRDDRGYWKQVENYIDSHPKTEFSHCLCLDCAKKLHPDINFSESDY